MPHLRSPCSINSILCLHSDFWCLWPTTLDVIFILYNGQFTARSTALDRSDLSFPAIVQYCAVGQFRDLVESTAKDMPLQETLRKVLNFTSKGWDAAKAHAMKAVETDNRMRIWLSDDTHTRGLLFRCHLGRIDIDSPVGRSKSFSISQQMVNLPDFIAKA